MARAPYQTAPPSRELVAAELVRRGALKPQELAGLGLDPLRVPDLNAGPVDMPQPVPVMRDREKAFTGPIRGDAQEARRVADFGRQFQEVNSRQKSGGFWDYMPWATVGDPERQSMEGLTSKMMREMIRPGMGQTMNTPQEQSFAIASLPSRRALREVNDERVGGLQRDAWLKAARLDAAEKWLAARNTPEGFEAAWDRNLPLWERAYEARAGGGRAQPAGGGARPDQTRRDIANQTLRAKSGEAMGVKVLRKVRD